MTTAQQVKRLAGAGYDTQAICTILGLDALTVGEILSSVVAMPADQINADQSKTGLHSVHNVSEALGVPKDVIQADQQGGD